MPPDFRPHGLQLCGVNGAALDCRRGGSQLSSIGAVQLAYLADRDMVGIAAVGMDEDPLSRRTSVAALLLSVRQSAVRRAPLRSSPSLRADQAAVWRSDRSIARPQTRSLRRDPCCDRRTSGPTPQSSGVASPSAQVPQLCDRRRARHRGDRRSATSFHGGLDCRRAASSACRTLRVVDLPPRYWPAEAGA